MIIPHYSFKLPKWPYGTIILRSATVVLVQNWPVCLSIVVNKIGKRRKKAYLATFPPIWYFDCQMAESNSVKRILYGERAHNKPPPDDARRVGVPSKAPQLKNKEN